MNIVGTVPANLIPKGHQQLTPSAATGLTVPDGAKYAAIRTTGQNIRIRDDGTNPTALIGLVIGTGDVNPFWYVGNLHELKMVQVAASATVDVLYYGDGTV